MIPIKQFLFWAFCLISSSALAQQFNTYPLYSNNSNVIEISCIETPNHVLVAAVYDNPVQSGGDVIVLLRSLDYGISWDSVTTLSTDSVFGSYYDPFLSCDSMGNLYFVAMRGTAVNLSNYNGHDTWVLKSSDDGLTWTLNGASPNTGANSGTDFPRTVAWSNGMLVLTYQLSVAPATYINIARSFDGGNSWNALDTIPASTTDQICCSSLGIGPGSKINLSFYNFNSAQLFHAESADSGKTFSTPQVVSSVFDHGYYFLTSMLSNKNVQHKGIVSHPSHRFDKTYYTYTADGITWNTTFLDSMSAYADGFMDSSGTVHVSYGKIKGSEYYLYYRYSLDSGATFSSPLVIDSNPIIYPLSIGMGDYCSIFKASDGKIHISWCANDGVNCTAKHSVISGILTSSDYLSPKNKYTIKYSSSSHSLQISRQENDLFSIEILNAENKIVYQNNACYTTLSIDTEKFKTGIYFIRILDAAGQQVVKQVLMH